MLPNITKGCINIRDMYNYYCIEKGNIMINNNNNNMK